MRQHLESFVGKKLGEFAVAYKVDCLKLSVTGISGYPDYLLKKAPARVAFVETKQLGKDLRKLQKERCKELRDQGFKVYEKIDTPEKAHAVIKEFAES